MSEDKKIIKDIRITLDENIKSEVQPIKQEKIEQRPKPVIPPKKKKS